MEKKKEARRSQMDTIHSVSETVSTLAHSARFQFALEKKASRVGNFESINNQLSLFRGRHRIRKDGR